MNESLPYISSDGILIWLDEGQITEDLYQYLAKVKPAFHYDPTEGPYNHGYVLGEFDTILKYNE
jgi:hypothetical protein